MLNLCEFLEVKEYEVFLIEGLQGEYSVHSNKILMRKQSNLSWKDSCAIDINLIVKNGIRKKMEKKFDRRTLAFFKTIDKKYKWITKDKDGMVKIHKEKPERKNTTWIIPNQWVALRCFDRDLFKNILWEDDEPLYIDDYVDRS